MNWVISEWWIKKGGDISLATKCRGGEAADLCRFGGNLICITSKSIHATTSTPPDLEDCWVSTENASLIAVEFQRLRVQL